MHLLHRVPTRTKQEWFSRVEVSFPSGNAECAAWLYLPEREHAPLVILAHGIGGIREVRLDVYAERFAKAGYAALVFDYRSFGGSGGEPRQLGSISGQQADMHAALAYARTLTCVDSRRIALWGTSFAGGHVMDVAARDGQVAALIAQAPFTSGFAAVRAMSLLSLLGIGAIGILDALSRLFTGQPVLVPLVGPPGFPAILNAPDAIEILAQFPEGSRLTRTLSRHHARFGRGRMPLPANVATSALPAQAGFWDRVLGSVVLPSGTRLINGIAAQFALRVPFWRPGSALKRVRCPSLICVADRDLTTPAGPTIRFAKAAPRAELIHYDVGHFGIYTGITFERAVRDQISFLTRVFDADGHTR